MSDVGFYIALLAVVLFSALLGWWANDWWRQIKEQDEEVSDGTDR